MNRWLLTALGLTVAGSALAATTASTAAAKAKTPRQNVATRPASAHSTATVPKTARPIPAVVAETRAAPSPAIPEPVTAEPRPALTPSAAPNPDSQPTDKSPDPVIVEDRDVVITESRKQPVRFEDRVVDLDVVDGNSLSPVGGDAELTLGRSFSAMGLTDTTPVPLRKAISLDLSNATPVEAVEALVKQVGGPIAVAFDKGIPNENRITLKVKQVSAAALLGLITQNAGLGWSMNVPGKGQTAELRITRMSNPLRSAVSFLQNPNRITAAGGGLVDVLISPRAESSYLTATRTAILGEQRLSLECPHCKAKSTIIRQRHQPKCTKCTRNFQSDWQFCPADGSKRPADPNEWKFCPNCGKKVEVERATDEGSIRILGDLPIVGQLFRNSPTPKPLAPKLTAPSRPASPETPMVAKPEAGALPATPPVPATKPEPVDPAK